MPYPIVSPEDVQALRKARRAGHHMPGWYYTSEQIFSREANCIFMRDWFCLGRAEEIGRLGDYMTIDVAGEPIVATRAKDGRVHVFANVCSHRGARVVAGSGNAGKFVCPYHGWVFDLTGALRNAPFTDEVKGFDFSTCRLTPLRVELWAGWIFAKFDRGDHAFDAFIGEYAQKLGYFHMEECRLGDRLEMEVAANWKLVVENFIDVYHFGTLHAKTFGVPSNAAIRLPYEDGAHIIFRPGHRAFNPRRPPAFGEMAFLAKDHQTAAGFLPPNAYFTCHSDCVRLWTAWPIGSDRTRAVIYSIYPADVVSRADFAERTAPDRDFLREVLTEDLDMMANLQSGLRSQSFRPGPMASLEQGVSTVIGYTLDRILDEGAARPSA